jgi:hypothetical protein
MNITTRKTRACTLDTMDEELKAAIRAYGIKYGLDDIESDILMCCETISIHQKKGLFGGVKTTLSAVYVTPKWLVWADSNGRSDVTAGIAQLSQIDVRDYETTAQYSITPDQGLNITGRYTDKNKTGITFIVLDSEAEGQKFREVLKQALRRAVVKVNHKFGTVT